MIDGENLRVLPASLDIEPFSPRSTAHGQFGDVQIEWPGMRGSGTFTVVYRNLAEEDADAVTLMCSGSPGLGKTVRFGLGENDPIYATQRIRCEPSATQHGWDVTLTFVAVGVPL